MSRRLRVIAESVSRGAAQPMRRLRPPALVLAKRVGRRGGHPVSVEVGIVGKPRILVPRAGVTQRHRAGHPAGRIPPEPKKHLLRVHAAAGPAPVLRLAQALGRVDEGEPRVGVPSLDRVQEVEELQGVARVKPVRARSDPYSRPSRKDELC